MRRPVALTLTTALAISLAACAPSADTDTAQLASTDEPLRVISDAATGGLEQGMAALSAQAATTYFTSTPAAVLCDGSEAAVQRGTELATTAGIPLLCGPQVGAFADTLQTLGANFAFAVQGTDTADLAETSGATVVEVPDSADLQAIADGSLDEDAPKIAPATTIVGAPAEDEDAAGDDGESDNASDEDAATEETSATEEGSEDAQRVVTYALDDLDSAPARATAQAAGSIVLPLTSADPRATSESVRTAAEHQGAPAIALGDAFGSVEDLQWKIETAATGVELPGGGQLVAPGKIYIALYGTPGTGSLGILGEQPVAETVVRAQETAGWYEDLTDATVVPTMEIIASVAIGAPGSRGTYTNVQSIDTLRPLVDAAKEAGQYVVLDLQPGREDFLTQAMEYEELLREPHVGLALDPEWRLKPDQLHLRQIGQVDVVEVNAVVEWLADLTRENSLPQKFLVLHSFQTRMIPDMDTVDQSREELQVLVHVDGQGGQQAKQGTWNTLRQYAPSIELWGWKNFIDEDIPMLTPEQTIEQVHPEPVFISYQ